MSLESCPKCGHLTRVYADQGDRLHYPGCSLDKSRKENSLFPFEEIIKIAQKLAEIEDSRFPDFANGNWDGMEQTQQDAYTDAVSDAMQAFEEAGYVFVKNDWLTELYAAYEKQNDDDS